MWKVKGNNNIEKDERKKFNQSRDFIKLSRSFPVHLPRLVLAEGLAQLVLHVLSLSICLSVSGEN